MPAELKPGRTVHKHTCAKTTHLGFVQQLAALLQLCVCLLELGLLLTQQVLFLVVGIKRQKNAEAVVVAAAVTTC